MLFFTPAQWLVLGLVLVGGWLLGLASHPGGRRWKTRYLAERDAHAGYRRETDTRAAEWKARATELEHENARLAKAAPVAPVATRADERIVRPASAARPAFATGEKRGWFDWAPRR